MRAAARGIRSCSRRSQNDRRAPIKATEARDLLAPVYDWFTEGFATAGLKEAKTLLDDLV